MPEEPPGRREIAFAYSVAQVGLEMVVPIGIGLALDYRFDWLPWATVIGAVLGFAVGMLHLINLLSQRRDSGPTRSDREPR